MTEVLYNLKRVEMAREAVRIIDRSKWNAIAERIRYIEGHKLNFPPEVMVESYEQAANIGGSTLRRSVELELRGSIDFATPMAVWPEFPTPGTVSFYPDRNQGPRYTNQLGPQYLSFNRESLAEVREYYHTQNTELL